MASNRQSRRKNNQPEAEPIKKTSPWFDLKNLVDFTWVAKQSTPRAPLFKGLFPTLGTFFTLLAITGVLTAGVMLWSGAAVTLASFFPVYTTAALGVIAGSLINFWFHRDITTAILNSREVRKKFKFDEHNPTDIYKLVNHVRHELNSYFRTVHGNHVDLPMPRLCVYTGEKPELQVSLGRTPDKAALYFSSAFFDSHNTRWNQKHLAALVAHKLTQVYYRRGWSATIVSIMGNLLQTLENMQGSENTAYRAIGTLAGPLRLFFFLQRAVERSYAYEATKPVVAIGRGMDFYDAIDIKVAPSLHKQPSYSYLILDSERKKREPYNGLFARWLAPLFKKLDDQVLTEDKSDKQGYRIVSWIDAFIREFIYSFNELLSKDPRTTRLKDHLRSESELNIGRVGRSLASNELNRKAPLREALNKLLKDKHIDGSFQQDLVNRLSAKLGVSNRQARDYLNEPLENYLSKRDKNQRFPHYKKALKIMGALEIERVTKKQQSENIKIDNTAFSNRRPYDVIGPHATGRKIAL
jgi:hypothetical protein